MFACEPTNKTAGGQMSGGGGAAAAATAGRGDVFLLCVG